ASLHEHAQADALLRFLRKQLLDPLGRGFRHVDHVSIIRDEVRRNASAFVMLSALSRARRAPADLQLCRLPPCSPTTPLPGSPRGSGPEIRPFSLVPSPIRP